MFDVILIGGGVMGVVIVCFLVWDYGVCVMVVECDFFYVWVFSLLLLSFIC